MVRVRLMLKTDSRGNVPLRLRAVRQLHFLSPLLQKKLHSFAQIQEIQGSKGTRSARESFRANRKSLYVMLRVQRQLARPE